jgi:putative oxidoreductase
VIRVGPLDALRLTCGLFLLPHFTLKLRRYRLLHQFYERARLPYPRILAPLGVLVEGLVVTSLLSDYVVHYGAMVGVAFMLVAAWATVRVNGLGKWRWEKGGPEYPLYLAATLLILAWYSQGSTSFNVGDRSYQRTACSDIVAP